MTRRTSAFLVLALVAAAGLAAACTSTSKACNGTPTNLVGTYALVSYTTGNTTIPAPPAVGTLRFHVSTYGVVITLPGPITIADSGTYTQCGTSGLSERSLSDSIPQFTGVYTLFNDTLIVTGTAAGTSVANVWAKQP
jgi:hypothetical protein